MLAKIKTFLDNPVNHLFVFFGLFFLILVSALYLVMGKTARDSLIEQMLHREQAQVRSGAASLDGFFSLMSRTAVTLAKQKEIADLGPESQSILEGFVDDWAKTPISGVVLADRNGIVRVNANRDKNPDVGVDISDREHFIWAKQAGAGEVFISQPIISRLGASRGKMILLVATPLVVGGRFNGVLSVGVVVPELVDEYLNPLRLTEKTRIYLVDEQGTIIAAPIERLIGVNYFEYLEKIDFLGRAEVTKVLKERLTNTKEGKLRIALADEIQGGLTPFLIAHAPVSCDFCPWHWTLAIATPRDQALLFITPFYTRQIAVMTVAFLVLLAWAAVFVRGRRLSATTPQRWRGK